MEAIENMDEHYIQLPVAGKAEKKESIYRERVYCYELYHQLLCVLDKKFPYKLHGEVDKAGHTIIRNAKKPDFIIHQPGNMENNLVIIEVKPITVKDRINELKEDIKTLKWFLNEANYYRAIALIYGNENGDLPNNIKKEVDNISDERIVTLWNYDAHKKPKNISSINYIF